MTPLVWKRRPENRPDSKKSIPVVMKRGIRNNLGDSQWHGAVLVALSALVIPALIHFYQEHIRPAPVILSGLPAEGCLAVEVDGDVEQKGIYFIRRGQRLSDLLSMLGIGRSSQARDASSPDLSMPLDDGIRIHVTTGNSQRSSIAVERMAASKRLALSRPIDVNRASLEELILVPGIGEKTALKIIAARNRSGGFRRLEDLMKIKGIKRKRLARLKTYLYVEGV
ncbi:ComEA family DNA-binding protein [Syntrophus buswellii]|uniref:ComEA family DNA-binding protein n=1 Tax=Syntrophus buswellii TaxID=43774 RepID=UPI0038D50B6C